MLIDSIARLKSWRNRLATSSGPVRADSSGAFGPSAGSSTSVHFPRCARATVYGSDRVVSSERMNR